MACERGDGEGEGGGWEEGAVDLGGPGACCEDEACAGDCGFFLGGGVLEGYGGEGAGWGACD